MNGKERAGQAVTKIKEAIGIRAQITELYRKYRDLSNTACFAAGLNHRDVKRAVDALYYLGGGWPTPESKGRMEAAVENFVGMYRILAFIGEAHHVNEHMAKFGMSCTLKKDFEIEDRELEHNERVYLQTHFGSGVFTVDDIETLRDLVKAVVMECQELQGGICSLADTIKDELKPAAQELLEIDNPEYDRLHGLVRLELSSSPRADETATKQKHRMNVSFHGLNEGIGQIKAR